MFIRCLAAIPTRGKGFCFLCWAWCFQETASHSYCYPTVPVRLKALPPRSMCIRRYRAPHFTLRKSYMKTQQQSSETAQEKS